MHVDQELIDRLVDGEVTEEERRQVLCALAEDAELCRQVALAYLEAQEWRRCLRRAVNELGSAGDFSKQDTVVPDRGRMPGSADFLTSDATGLSAGPAIRKGSWLSRFPHVIVPIASCFLLAFLGVWWGLNYLYTSRPAESPGGTGFVRAPRGMAENTQQTAGTQGGVSLESQPQSASFLQMVTVPVAVANDGTVTTLDVPVIPLADGVEANIWPETVLPQYVLDTLRKRGHIIHQKRHFLPVLLPDGRQTIVPIDQVEIQFGN